MSDELLNIRIVIGDPEPGLIRLSGLLRAWGDERLRSRFERRYAKQRANIARRKRRA